MNNLIIVSGAAGSGKGTILAELFKKSDKFRYSVSCTTRDPRNGEIDGVNYFFISREEFEKRIDEGDFAEYVEYCGNFYGTSKSYIKKMQEDGNTVILEIETVGASKMMKLMPEALSVFIAPPSYEILEQRLRGRNTETEDKILERLNKAKGEVAIADTYDYILVNPDGMQEYATDVLYDVLCKRKTEGCDILKQTSAEKKQFIKEFF